MAHFRPAIKIGWLVLLVLATGCGRSGTAAPIGGSNLTPSQVDLRRIVELDEARERALNYTVETVGVLEAEGRTEIAAGVSGVVEEILFREGDQVTSDSILVKVDQRRYQADVEVARANERRAEANLSLAKDLAARSRRARGSISEEERTRAVLSLQVSQAELEAAKAARVRAETDLIRSRVRAPYTGRINRRLVSLGTYVQDNTPIATIADISTIRVVGWIPETAAARVRELYAEQENRIRLHELTLPLGGHLTNPLAAAAAHCLVQNDNIPSGYDPEFTLPLAFPDRTFRAKIFYLSTIASPDTHMFECKAEIDTRFLDVELRPGYAARLRFPLRSKPNACVIPEESVRATERGFVVFVPEKNITKDGNTEWIARARTLILGYRSPGWVEVRQGLRSGDRIVRRGAEALEDGTPIRFE